MPPAINLPLKMAILRRGTQRFVAFKAAIPEARLSTIVHGAEPTAREKRDLAKALRMSQRALFPPSPTRTVGVVATEEALTP